MLIRLPMKEQIIILRNLPQKNLEKLHQVMIAAVNKSKGILERDFLEFPANENAKIIQKT